MLQEAIGEAAGGDAPVQTDPPVHHDRKSLQTSEQFFATAGHEPGRLLHLQLKVVRHLNTGLIEQLTSSIPDFAGTDQLLRLLTRHRQTARQELQIKPLF